MSSYRFQEYRLDPQQRRLWRGGEPLAINARYFDALTLLVEEAGALVSKQRFLDEVWSGVPVTDEALTQCIRSLRRLLDDSASAPAYIETVPKHGYRFIAAVTCESGGAVTSAPVIGGEARASATRWLRCARLAAAGTIGGGLAGALGGLFYGMSGASQLAAAGMGALSVFAVLMSINIAVGLMAGAGVACGIAAAHLLREPPRSLAIVGGALGGFVVGAAVKLLGSDGFALLVGRTPGDITGAGEGALLGGAVGLAVWLAGAAGLRRLMGAAAIAGGLAGLAIALLGGHLMGGSLSLLAAQFGDSGLDLDRVGRLLGETGFGPFSRAATAMAEGALFAAFVAVAMELARRGERRAS